MINPTELLGARFYPSQDPHLFEEGANTVGGTKTYFSTTAFWLVKQAKSYQTRRNVKDVCLFDWDTLFILNFEDALDPNTHDPSGKSPQAVPAPKSADVDIDQLWPSGILYQEQAESSEGAAAAAAVYTFRSLLLAFLIRALKRVKKEPLGPITYDASRMLSSLFLFPDARISYLATNEG